MVDTFRDGDRLVGRRVDMGDGRSAFITGTIPMDEFGNSGSASASPLPAGTDRSGTTSATANTSTPLAAANATRRGLNIQNISGAPMGINEFGNPAVIGGAGTYTLAPGASINVRTNRSINVVSGTASQAYTATEF